MFQLNRYSKVGATYVKDNRLVKIPSDILDVPVSADNDICVKRKFRLKATISHSGTLNAGHYWAYVREGNSKWLKCNDTSVSSVQFKELSSNSSYVLVYCAD